MISLARKTRECSVLIRKVFYDKYCGTLQTGRHCSLELRQSQMKIVGVLGIVTIVRALSIPTKNNMCGKQCAVATVFIFL